MKRLLILLPIIFFCINGAYIGNKGPTFETKEYGKEFKTGLVIPKDFGKCRTEKSACKVTKKPKLFDGDLPAKFDWREKGLSPIQNQGSCGSCWAFAMSATLEDNLYLRGISKDDVSQQYLVGHDYESSGCGGGWMEFHMYKGNSRYPGGTMLEGDCPYQARSRKCSNYSESKLKHKIKDWGYVDEARDIPDTELLKRYIYSYGPVAVAVAAGGSFSSYRSGIYNGSTWGSINHAVNLVGWDDTQDPPHWIMRNSWGNWGDNGYMRIAYKSRKIGYAATYIDYDGTTIDQDPGPEPTPDPWWKRLPWTLIAIAVLFLAVLGLVIYIVVRD